MTDGKIRLTIIVTPGQRDYVAAMAAVVGVSMTQFVQYLIEQDIKQNKKQYDQIQRLKAAVKGN